MTPQRLATIQAPGNCLAGLALLWRRYAGAGAAALVVFLVGCASQPMANAPTADTPSEANGTTAGDRGVGEALAGFLSKHPGTATTTLDSSPWGDDVRVTARPVYFAASGRECRDLRIRPIDGGPVQYAVACTVDGGWTAHRPITRIIEDGAESP